LDVEPAKYFVVVTKREKRVCKSCEERGVLAAPLPPRIIETSLVSDRVAIDAVVKKYADHWPLYRQGAMLERDSGLELSCQTLGGWVMRVGELLVLLAEALRHELLRGSYLQADETPAGVQMHNGSGSNHLAYLWQYGRPQGQWCSISAWGAGAKARNVFWRNSMAFCKAVDTPFTIPWVGRRWCTRLAGRIHEENSSKR
jgi:transposase